MRLLVTVELLTTAVSSVGQLTGDNGFIFICPGFVIFLSLSLSLVPLLCFGNQTCGSDESNTVSDVPHLK